MARDAKKRNVARRADRRPKDAPTREVQVECTEDRRILDFRPLGFRDVLVLGRYHYAEAHPVLPAHSHYQMLEICYLDSGQQTYCVGNEEFHLNGGDLFLTLPNELHGSGKAPEGKGVLYWMLIRVPGRRGRLLSLGPLESRRVIERLTHLRERQFPGGHSMGRVLRRIFAAFDLGSDPLRIVSLQNLLVRFLLDVIEASGGTRRDVSPEIQAVQQAIDENVGQAWPIRHLARLAHLSESRFKARFKAEVGIPPADYAMRARIERAKQWLGHSDASITQIAQKLGFSTMQYFDTAFKRYVGHTPTAYRRRLEEGPT